MKRKYLFTFILVIIILSLAFSLVACKKADLIKGASIENMFAYKNLDEAKKDWKLVHSGSTENVYSFAENGLTFSDVNGYAYVSQEIRLKPGSYYKVSYNYHITSPLEGTGDTQLSTIGLFIGFEEDPNFNVRNEQKTNHTAIADETNKEKPIVFYLKADRSRSYNLKISLGTKDLPVKGSATINNLKIVKVSETIAKEQGKHYGLYNIKSTVFGKASVDNIVYIILGVLLILIVGFVFYQMKSRDLAFVYNKSKNKFYDAIHSKKAIAPIILVSGSLIIRILILAIQVGLASQKSITETLFGFNLEQLSYQGQWIAKHGTTFFLKNNPSSFFLPVPLYLSSLAGVIGNTSTANSALITVSLLKLFAVFADIGTVLIIYRIIAKREGNSAALIMSLLYSLMPVMFLASGEGWSVTSSFATFSLVLALFFLLEKKYILSSSMFFIACMTSVSSLLLVPAFVLYAGVHIVLAIKDKKTKDYISAIVAFIGFFFVFYLLTLPFSVDFIKNGSAMHSFEHFIAIVKGQNFYTLNAFNFQGLLKNNFATITTQSTLVSILFILFLVVLVSALYIRSRNRLQLVVLTSAFGIMIWTFLNNMTPEVLILLLLPLFIGAALYKDKRLYFAFILYTLIAYINLSYVHLIVGYNQSGILHIDYSKTPIMYVMGSLSIIVVIYYIVILYDILISKKLSPIKPIEIKYAEHVKRQTKKINNSIKLANSKIKLFFLALSEERKQNKARKEVEKEIDSNEKSEDEK